MHISRVGIKKLKLDKLIWVVTKKNPLKKKPLLNLKTRIKLSKKVAIKEKKILVQYLDKKIKSTKTFNLLKYIKNKNQKKEIYFLLGADNLVKFNKWQNWKKIPKLAKIVVFPRQNYPVKSMNSILPKILKNNLIYVSCKKVNISSSLIRKFW